MNAPDQSESISRDVIYGAQFQVIRITTLQTGQIRVGLRVQAEGRQFTFGVHPDTARQVAGSLLKAADLAESDS
jgi:hypothetical protein